MITLETFKVSNANNIIEIKKTFFDSIIVNMKIHTHTFTSTYTTTVHVCVRRFIANLECSFLPYAVGPTAGSRF